jgi:hypothetical protein
MGQVVTSEAARALGLLHRHKERVGHTSKRGFLIWVAASHTSGMGRYLCLGCKRVVEKWVYNVRHGKTETCGHAACRAKLRANGTQHAGT